MEASERTQAEEGRSVSPSRTRRPATSSLSRRMSTLNFGKKLGRTKSSLTMDSRPSISFDQFSERLHSIRMDSSQDKQGLTLEASQDPRLTRRGSIRGYFKSAQNSIKSKTKTSRSEKARPHLGHTAEPSTFKKLCQRVISKTNKHGIFMESQDDHYSSPLAGPRIPIPFGGDAAKASLVNNNNIYNPSICRCLGNFEDNQGDRESGIGIATAASTASFQQDVVESDTVTRVDFLQRLPNELASQVLSHLDLRSLLAVEMVSREWNRAASDSHVWREVFIRDRSRTYATSQPIAPGSGLGLPDLKPAKDWKNVYKIRRQLERNWTRGIAQSIYLHGHQDSIYCIQFDENKIITGSRDKTIRIWDLATFKCTMVIGCAFVIDELKHMESSEISVHYATGFADRHTTTSRPKALSFPMNHNASILCLQYDDEILVTGSSDSTCIVHDIKNGYEPIMRLQHHTLAVLDLAFDKNYIVTCSKDTTICVWDRKTGDLIKQLRGHTGPVNAIQLRGNSIISCSGDTMVKLWNIESGRIVREFRGHKKGLACSQFSEDSKLIASAGNDKSIRIWDANTGELLREIDAHQNLVRSLHIDSVSGRLISGSYDQDIKVWNIATGQLMLDFPKWHASWVLGAKCDYRRIISTGQDPKVLIMDFGSDVDGIELLESTPRSAERAHLDARNAAQALRELEARRQEITYEDIEMLDRYSQGDMGL